MLKVAAYAAPVLTLATIAALAAAGSFTTAPPVADIAYLFALGLAVSARLTFPKGTFRGGPSPASSTVIRRGPYRYVRHPMYSAALLLIGTAAIVHLAWWTAAAALAVAAAAAGRIAWEERLLRSTFNDYEEYAASTRAVIPYIL